MLGYVVRKVGESSESRADVRVICEDFLHGSHMYHVHAQEENVIVPAEPCGLHHIGGSKLENALGHVEI